MVSAAFVLRFARLEADSRDKEGSEEPQDGQCRSRKSLKIGLRFAAS